MRFISLSLSIAVSIGCETFGSLKPESEWIVLDQAKKVSCDPFSRKENELAIGQVTRVGAGKSLGLVTEVILRTGEQKFYYAPFDGSADVERPKEDGFSLDKGSFAVGQVQEGNKVHLVMVTPSDPPMLHYVDPNASKVMVSHQLSSAASAGRLVAAGKSNWLAFDSEPAKVFMLSSVPGTEPPPSFEIPAYPLFIEGKNRILAAYENVEGEDTEDEERPVHRSIRLRALDFKGRTQTEWTLVKDAAAVEKWSAAASPKGLFLLEITGDSMVGRSEVEVRHFTIAGKEISQVSGHQLKQKDAHLAEPRIFQVGNDTSIFFMTWLDGEATLSKHKIINGKIEKPEFYGVFPQGAALLDVFTYGESNDTFTLMRSKRGDFWDFHLCRIP